MHFDLGEKQIIAFDLDGTLSHSKQPIGAEMVSILEKLTKHVEVAVISGSSFDQFQKQFLQFWNGPKNNLTVMPVEGSQCYEYDESKTEWQLVESEQFPESLKQKVYIAIDRVIQNPQFQIKKPDEAHGNLVEDRGTQITFSALGQNAPIEEKEVWDPDQKKRFFIREELTKLLPDVDIVLGGTTSIDFLPKGFDKATGLKKLLKRRGLTMGDMLFVGDAIFPGGNDFAPSEAGIESIKISGPEETKSVIQKLLGTHSA